MFYLNQIIVNVFLQVDPNRWQVLLNLLFVVSIVLEFYLALASGSRAYIVLRFDWTGTSGAIQTGLLVLKMLL